MGKKLDTLLNIGVGIYAVTSTIFADNSVKPEWLIKYRKREWEIKKKLGMNDAEIKKVLNVLIEYNVLENEGKKIY